MAERVIRGKVWKGGDNIYAFQIVAQEHWTRDRLDADELGRWAMEKVAPEFKSENAFRRAGFSIIVAGHNFGGGGKSIEHPIKALQGAGVKVVIAESFSRLQFRNAINGGLPFVVCKGVTDRVETGQEMEVDLATGKVTNITTGKELQGAPIPDFVLEIADAGGYLEFTRLKLLEAKLKQQTTSVKRPDPRRVGTQNR